MYSEIRSSITYLHLMSSVINGRNIEYTYNSIYITCCLRLVLSVSKLNCWTIEYRYTGKCITNKM